jgi:hypothetical protein
MHLEINRKTNLTHNTTKRALKLLEIIIIIIIIIILVYSQLKVFHVEHAGRVK